MALPFASWLPHLGRLGRAERWRRTRGRPRVWAHRGASARAPENTMVAFERARREGADGIELDVRLDGDGEVVVFHDAALDRLTRTPGWIGTTGSAARRLLRVGGEPIPTLAEVLHASGELDVNVEIKAERVGRSSAVVAATAQVIRASGQAARVLVSSFDPIALLHMHRLLPDVAIGYLFADDQSFVARRGWVGSWIGAAALHAQHTLCTAERVRAWHAAGHPVNVWTVDDADELRRLAALGVDGVFANDPAHALSILSAAVA